MEMVFLPLDIYGVRRYLRLNQNGLAVWLSEENLVFPLPGDS
jgi:hypothetical protein